MGLSRTLYSTQFLSLKIQEGVGSAITQIPLQSASIERTIPTDDILVLGRLGSVGRQQKEVETVKMDLKIFWASGSKTNSTDPNFNSNLGARLTHSHLISLTGNALKGIRSEIVVGPQGFTGYGILTNFSIDAGVGDFLTASMSFEGLGTPIIAKSTTDPLSSAVAFPQQAVAVYTSQNVILGSNGPSNVNPTETIKSAKFSIDIPTERLSRIGGALTGLQTSAIFTGNNILVAKPPFKVSVSYDGELVTGSHATDVIQFGHVKFTPKSAAIISQSLNQNAGDVGASMSFSSEGTDCLIEIATP